MIVLSRKKIGRALLTILIFTLIATLTLGFGLLEAWVFHRVMPKHTDDPWYWAQYPVRPMFSPRTEGFSMYVDLDMLTLTLYKDGVVYKVYPCSGGRKQTPSPLGEWQTTSEGDWGEGFGGSWIAINCPWGKFGIHGTIEPWTIGTTNASHGCIRMLNADVAELKKLVGRGTPIFIKYDGILFRAMKSGMIGSDVLELQRSLYDLGYIEFTPDGRFGAGTEAAVKQFQRDRGMYADGVAGRGTMDALDVRD